MKTLACCLMPLLLAACATSSELVSSAPTTVIQVPVLTPCVDEKDIPAVPPKTRPGPGMTQQAAAIAADLEAYESYAKQADTLLRICATKAPEHGTTEPQ